MLTTARLRLRTWRLTDSDGNPILLDQHVPRPYDDLWNRATDSVTVTLADLEGPRVGNVVASPAVLWPPNRQMVPVTVTAGDVRDACSGPVTCRIDSVTSNESLAPGDFVITGALTVQLRADRLGGGTGRIYTIIVTCTDAAGNSTQKSVTVAVPHEG